MPQTRGDYDPQRRPCVTCDGTGETCAVCGLSEDECGCCQPEWRVCRDCAGHGVQPLPVRGEVKRW